MLKRFLFFRPKPFFQIRESRKLAVEMQFDGADRAVALFGDDDVGDTVYFLAALLPAAVTVVEFADIFFGALGRLAA